MRLSELDVLVQSGYLNALYGPDENTIQTKRSFWIRTIQALAEICEGDRDTVAARAPGRANLMGMHIEHQCGSENHVLLSREVLTLGVLNETSSLRVYNTNATFLPYVNDGYQVRSGGGRNDWWPYVRGAIEAVGVLGKRSVQSLVGADLLVAADLPMAATLGSSSSLSVSLVSALCALNGIDADKRDIVNAVARGEELAGVHGGPGDPAAILLGARDCVVHLDYGKNSDGVVLPERSRHVPLPPNTAFVICHSGGSAVKAAGARDVFHSRIAAYKLGWLILEEYGLYPRSAGLFKGLTAWLRDGRASEILRLALALPLALSRAEACRLLPLSAAELEEIFGDHTEPECGYQVRGVWLFGACEHARALQCVELMSLGDCSGFGRLMSAGHNGDRLFSLSAGTTEKFSTEISDEHLLRLQPISTEGLCMIPGQYRCSTAALDRIVDIAASVPGVHGARLTGSGLGGCAVILCDGSAADTVVQKLGEFFSTSEKIEPLIWRDRPHDPAGLVVRPNSVDN